MQHIPTQHDPDEHWGVSTSHEGDAVLLQVGADHGRVRVALSPQEAFRVAARLTEAANRITDTQPAPRVATLTEAFAALAKAANGAWDGVNPDEYVRELRGHPPRPECGNVVAMEQVARAARDKGVSLAEAEGWLR